MYNVENLKKIKQIVLEDRDYLEHHLSFSSWCSVEHNASMDVDKLIQDVKDFPDVKNHCGTTFCLAGYLHYLAYQKDQRVEGMESCKLTSNVVSEWVYPHGEKHTELSIDYLFHADHSNDYDAMIKRIDTAIELGHPPKDWFDYREEVYGF